MSEVIVKTEIKELPMIYRGKVRDTYDMGENLLIVSTDRLSAFDVVFNDGIPHKGEVLNGLSVFWFKKTKKIVKNHFITDRIPKELPSFLQKRSMIVSRAKPILLEAVVRGYITGSALKEYEKSGSVAGVKMPTGLKNGDEFPEPIFTPALKIESGHDENVIEEAAAKKFGKDVVDFIKEKSLKIYEFGKRYAMKCGLVLADTKLEFGYLNDEIILIDELLTPDSSRYWMKYAYDEGRLESLDKQFVRDYLERTGWNKEPPAPKLPAYIIENTSKRYLEAYRRITGKELM